MQTADLPTNPPMKSPPQRRRRRLIVSPSVGILAMTTEHICSSYARSLCLHRKHLPITYGGTTRECVCPRSWSFGFHGRQSAGTRAVIGHPIELTAAKSLGGLGRGVRQFPVRRRLTARIASEADLILTMSERHRDKVLGLAPMQFRRTFTLREAARLAEESGRQHCCPNLPDARTRYGVRDAEGHPRPDRRRDAGSVSKTLEVRSPNFSGRCSSG